MIPDSPERRQRDFTVIGAVGLVHSTSHIFQFCLPPMFPLLQEEFGMGFAALGSVVAAFYLASGIGQSFVGIFVDRWGGRRVLAIGMTCLAGSMLAIAFVPAFWMILPLAVLAGAGNSVFHPADFAILASRVHPSRTGRAFSIHAFGGTIGYVVSPLLLSALGFWLGWRTGLAIAGVYGLGQAAFVFLARDLLGEGAASAATAKEGPREVAAAFAKLLVMPAMLAAFVYLTMTAMAGAGLQTFAAASLSAIHGVDFRAATMAVTLYLVGNAIGILGGGFVADATDRQCGRVCTQLPGRARTARGGGHVRGPHLGRARHSGQEARSAGRDGPHLRARLFGLRHRLDDRTAGAGLVPRPWLARGHALRRGVRVRRDGACDPRRGFLRPQRLCCARARVPVAQQDRAAVS